METLSSRMAAQDCHWREIESLQEHVGMLRENPNKHDTQNNKCKTKQKEREVTGKWRDSMGGPSVVRKRNLSLISMLLLLFMFTLLFLASLTASCFV